MVLPTWAAASLTSLIASTGGQACSGLAGGCRVSGTPPSKGTQDTARAQPGITAPGSSAPKARGPPPQDERVTLKGQGHPRNPRQGGGAEAGCRRAVRSELALLFPPCAQCPCVAMGSVLFPHTSGGSPDFSLSPGNQVCQLQCHLFQEACCPGPAGPSHQPRLSAGQCPVA